MNPPPGEQLVGALTVNPIPINTCWSGFYTHCVPSRTVKEAKSPLDF